MIKKFLKKIRNFWWMPFYTEISTIKNSFPLTHIYTEISTIKDFLTHIYTEISTIKDSLTHIYTEISTIRNSFALTHRRNDQEYENQRKFNDPLHLDRYGYKVYSQSDEDGIICEIFKRIGTTNKIFVEFGVENGLESNCHFLLFSGWKGLWIDGNETYFQQLQEYFSKPLSTEQLTAVNAFITIDNINKLIGEDGKINGEIDLLSIDVDGNDYWIWERITCVQPRVVAIEYNAKFPPPCEWVMEYDPKYIWDGSDKQGASLKSLELLGDRLGYNLVGTNKNGVNAFFVKKELVKGLFAEPATAENLYHARGYRYTSSGHPTKKYIGK
jgi:hypothetical protein